MQADNQFEQAVKDYHQSERNKRHKIDYHRSEIEKANQSVEDAYEKMVSLCPGHQYKGFMVKQCTVCGHVTSFLDIFSEKRREFNANG